MHSKTDQNKNVKFFSLFFIWLFLQVFASAQSNTDNELSQATVERDQRLLLALSNESYPVTPGDIYHLNFLMAGQSVSRDILVESDYTINLGTFGKVNGEGKTFSKLKPDIEGIISRAYRNSIPSLTITSVGMFQVFIKGEISHATYQTVWGLSRLDETIKSLLDPRSSYREVGIISKSGVLNKYDLFKAASDGNEHENPLLKAGDTIIIYTRGKEIEVAGEIQKPGKYQLIDSETLDLVLTDFAGGFTPYAANDTIQIERTAENGGKRILSFPVAKKEDMKKIALQDGDRIVLLPKLKTQPIITFEGAITPTGASTTEVNSTAGNRLDLSYRKIELTFIEGLTLFNALVQIKERIMPYADLENALLSRDAEGDTKSEQIINLEKLFYQYTPEADLVLKSFDKIFIPFKKQYVTIQGQVTNPGSYNYAPAQKYFFYLTQAGGATVEVLSPSNILIFDRDGKTKQLQDDIQPEDIIQVIPSLVYVSGAVNSVGQFPFVQNRNYHYYLNLAGGVNLERGSGQNVKITDQNGETKKKDADIQPGDLIYVYPDDMLNNFNKIAPFISATLAIVNTAILVITFVTPH